MTPQLLPSGLLWLLEPLSIRLLRQCVTRHHYVVLFLHEQQHEGRPQVFHRGAVVVDDNKRPYIRERHVRHDDPPPSGFR